MKANQKAGRNSKRIPKHLPETIEERVHRHISDINSQITDDDIRNVRTELDIRRGANDNEQKQEIANDKMGKKSK